MCEMMLICTSRVDRGKGSGPYDCIKTFFRYAIVAARDQDPRFIK